MCLISPILASIILPWAEDDPLVAIGDDHHSYNAASRDRVFDMLRRSHRRKHFVHMTFFMILLILFRPAMITDSISGASCL